jgi:hypothetical protein
LALAANFPPNEKTLRLAGKSPGLTTPENSRQATHLYLANLAATAQQKDDKENWYRNAEEPEEDVTRRACFLYSLGKFHWENRFIV